MYLTSNQHNSQFPKKYFNTPIYFEVMNDNYKMHLAPKIDDTIVNNYTIAGHSFKANNIIDTLIKGTRGRAIAAETDNTGRVWWLVELDANSKTAGHLFYEQGGDKTNKASKIGWISNRYVKKLEK